MYAVVVLSVCYLKDVNIFISTTCISFFVIELVGIIIPLDRLHFEAKWMVFEL